MLNRGEWWEVKQYSLITGYVVNDYVTEQKYCMNYILSTNSNISLNSINYCSNLWQENAKVEYVYITKLSEKYLKRLFYLFQRLFILSFNNNVDNTVLRFHEEKEYTITFVLYKILWCCNSRCNNNVWFSSDEWFTLYFRSSSETFS